MGSPLGIKVVAVPAGPTDCVVLDRVKDLAAPPYCIHGQTTCIGCGHWCWLGNKTHDIVATGQAAPLCKWCAALRVPPGNPRGEHVRDHRRADGPHG